MRGGWELMAHGVIFVDYNLQRGPRGEGKAESVKRRWCIQLGALDCWSTRALVAPTRNWTAQYSIGRLEHPEALEPGSQWRQTASVEYDRPTAAGHWAASLIRGRIHKIATDANLNSYLMESTLNFRQRNYVFSRLELVAKDELFPQAPIHPPRGSGRTHLGAFGTSFKIAPASSGSEPM